MGASSSKPRPAETLCSTLALAELLQTFELGTILPWLLQRASGCNYCYNTFSKKVVEERKDLIEWDRGTLLDNITLTNLTKNHLMLLTEEQVKQLVDIVEKAGKAGEYESFLVKSNAIAREVTAVANKEVKTPTVNFGWHFK